MAQPLNPAQVMEALRSEQAACWDRGEPVRAEALLRRYPAWRGDPEWALQLVYQEVLLRERHGEKPQLAEYVARFPHFAAQLRPLFVVHEVLESPQPSDISDHETALDLAPTGVTAEVKLPEVRGYELLGILGRGGMGVVYKARQVSLNRLVALKMIRAGAQAAPRELARFRTEAHVLACLQHPNIVQVYEVGESQGCPYLALEYMEGGSLADRLAGRPQPPRPTAELVEMLAEAIHSAHQRGMIHRDLKPANILLCPRPDGPGLRLEGMYRDLGLSSVNLSFWTPKITDFGLVKLFQAEMGQTQSGDVVGTPSYMAPEQAAGQRQLVTPATDVYALGAVLYELLTGRPPFLADTALNTLLQVRTREPLPPRRLSPEVPRDLEAICLKCLHKEPGQRYAQASLLADDLRRFRAGLPVSARPISHLERLWRWCRRQPALAGLATALALVGVGGLISLLTVLMVLVAAGYALLFGLWLRAERQRERAEDSHMQAEANLLRFHQRQTQAELHLLEAAQRRAQAEARAREALDARRRTERTLRETNEAVYRQFLLLESRLAHHQLQLGNALGQLGRFEEALAAYHEAVASWDRLVAAPPPRPELFSFLGVTWNNLGEVLRQLGRGAEAVAAFQQAVLYQGRARDAAPGESQYCELLGRHYLNMARVFQERGRLAEAQAAAHEGVKLRSDQASCGPMRGSR